MIEIAGKQFDDENPNRVSKALQFQGTIWYAFQEYHFYGFNESQVVQLINEVKKEIPSINYYEIHGPENHFSPRTFVCGQFI